MEREITLIEDRSDDLWLPLLIPFGIWNLSCLAARRVTGAGLWVRYALRPASLRFEIWWLLVSGDEDINTHRAAYLARVWCCRCWGDTKGIPDWRRIRGWKWLTVFDLYFLYTWMGAFLGRWTLIAWLRRRRRRVPLATDEIGYDLRNWISRWKLSLPRQIATLAASRAISTLRSVNSVNRNCCATVSSVIGNSNYLKRDLLFLSFVFCLIRQTAEHVWHLWIPISLNENISQEGAITEHLKSTTTTTTTEKHNKKNREVLTAPRFKCIQLPAALMCSAPVPELRKATTRDGRFLENCAFLHECVLVKNISRHSGMREILTSRADAAANNALKTWPGVYFWTREKLKFKSLKVSNRRKYSNDTR